MKLLINEVFYSVQGEGMRAGTANVFVRFSQCNMNCRLEEAEDSPGGFDCDTEFASGRRLEIDDLLAWMDEEYIAGGGPKSALEKWAILTGGEPALQLTPDLVAELKNAGWRLAIETNGSIAIPERLDWVTVSPKVAEHAVRQMTANEVKYVRGHGQAIPRPKCKAEHKLISPAFAGMEPDSRSVEWCLRLVRENPEWRLSAQMHKLWDAR
jgi:organic radical activating enzyme